MAEIAEVYDRDWRGTPSCIRPSFGLRMVRLLWERAAWTVIAFAQWSCRD